MTGHAPAHLGVSCLVGGGSGCVRVRAIYYYYPKYGPRAILMDTCSYARTATAVTSRRQGARIFIGGTWYEAETVRLEYGSSTFAKVLHEVPAEDFLAGDGGSEASKLMLAERSARTVPHSDSPSSAGGAVVDAPAQPAITSAAGCGAPSLRQDRHCGDGGSSGGGSSNDAIDAGGGARSDVACAARVRAPADAPADLCSGLLPSRGPMQAASRLWCDRHCIGDSDDGPGGTARDRGPVSGSSPPRTCSPPSFSPHVARLSPRQSAARCSCATVCSRCHPSAMGGIPVPPGAIILPRAVGDGLIPCTGNQTQIAADRALYAWELRLWLVWTADGFACFGDSTGAFSHWRLARRSLDAWVRRRRSRRDRASRSQASAVLAAWAVRRSARLYPARGTCATRMRGGGDLQSSPPPTPAASPPATPSRPPPPPPSKPALPHSTPPTRAPFGPAHPRLQLLDRLASVTRQLFPASPPRSDSSSEVAAAPLSSSHPLSLPPSLPPRVPPLVPPAVESTQEVSPRVLELELTGLRVQLGELAAKPGLDGELVEIIGPATDGRFPVRVIETAQRIRVRPRNFFYYGAQLSHEIPAEVWQHSSDLQNELALAGRTAAELHRFALGPDGHLGLARFFYVSPPVTPPAATAAPSPQGRSPMRRLAIEDDDGSPSAASPSAAPPPVAAPPPPVEPTPGWRPPPPPPPTWMPTALDLFVYASRAAVVQAMRRLGTAATYVFGSAVLEGRVRRGWRRLSVSARRYLRRRRWLSSTGVTMRCY